MCGHIHHHHHSVSRRGFLQTIGAGATLVSMASAADATLSAAAGSVPGIPKRKAKLVGAFLYTPTKQLNKEGYYSWPGSSFNPEQLEQDYKKQLGSLSSEMGFDISWEEGPIDRPEQFDRLAKSIQGKEPDGVILCAFKKTVWQNNGVKLLDSIKAPTVVLAPLGVLLIRSVSELEDKPGVCMISSSNPLEDVVDPLRMIHTNVEMSESVILNLQGDKRLEETRVPGLQTTVRTIPRQAFIDAFNSLGETPESKDLAQEYLKRAVEVVEPNETDVLDGAKSYFALKAVLEQEKADAMMMECLPGLKIPHEHVPPCMGFMSLRDEGVVMGCESDLDATLTMMLLQNLFGKPAFQHNPAVDTEKNHYFCAHCTSASKMRGTDHDPEPIALRSHAEAGWGCVPRVLFTENEEVTISKYLNGDAAQLLLYSGNILRCPPIPPAGGCRTNAEIKINELEDVADLKGHHLCMVYGNYVKDLKRFSQLNGIEVVI